MDTSTCFREAVRYATATVETLAAEAGYAKPTIENYLYHRAPSPAACEALAKALDRRADQLVRWARRLRKAAGSQGGKR